MDFPEEGAPTPKVDVKRYYLLELSPKLHGIENLDPEVGGGCASLVPPLRSANGYYYVSYPMMHPRSDVGRGEVPRSDVWGRGVLPCELSHDAFDVTSPPPWTE